MLSFHKILHYFLIYVDETIFFERNQSIIDRMITEIKKDFYLTDEGNFNEFISFQIVHNKDGYILMSQPVLIEKLIEYLKINDTTKKNDTSDLTKPFLKKL